ncbi:hypothetical protein MNBD_GAMMA17-999 [hydrothermal vent metagenome]|uniref:Uncharacterized protein n=1 Tax=hydrothermal vent metagenome TaxID=652676 RepID=A0A3B1A8Z1_9ZZZZ
MTFEDQLNALIFFHLEEHTSARHLEDFMFFPARCIKVVMDEIIGSISRYHQKARPGRSYERKSMKPESKWRGCKSKA